MNSSIVQLGMNVEEARQLAQRQDEDRRSESFRAQRRKDTDKPQEGKLSCKVLPSPPPTGCRDHNGITPGGFATPCKWSWKDLPSSSNNPASSARPSSTRPS